MVLAKLYYGLKRARENPTAYWAGQASGMGLKVKDYTGSNRAPIGAPVFKRLKSTKQKERMAYSSGGSNAKNIKNERGASTRDAAVKRGKKKRGVSLVKGKSVKVSASFKAKVSKVIESKKIHGTCEIASVGHLPGCSINRQAVQYMRSTESYDSLSAVEGSVQTWAFAPEWFLTCASVLFNKKPYVPQLTVAGYPTMRWYDSDQIGSGNAEGAGNDVGQSSISNNAVFTASGWEKYLIRNNTQRTVSMKIYLCAPKRTTTLPFDIYQANSITTSGSVDGHVDPIVAWQAALGQEIGTGRNLNSTTVNFLGQCPTESPQFNKLYKCEVTTVVLEPGQTYDYFIQGPKNMEINYGNMFINNFHVYIQKCMRFPLFVYHSDLVGCCPSTANVGSNIAVGSRWGMPNANATGSGLMVERRRFCRISMPEKTGFRFVEALTPGTVQMGFRRPAFFKLYLDGVSSAEKITRVDEENPVPQVGTANVIF